MRSDSGVMKLCHHPDKWGRQMYTINGLSTQPSSIILDGLRDEHDVPFCIFDSKLITLLTRVGIIKLNLRLHLETEQILCSQLSGSTYCPCDSSNG